MLLSAEQAYKIAQQTKDKLNEDELHKLLLKFNSILRLINSQARQGKYQVNIDLNVEDREDFIILFVDRLRYVVTPYSNLVVNSSLLDSPVKVTISWKNGG